LESSTGKIEEISVELRFSGDNPRPLAIVGLGDALAGKEIAPRLRKLEEECDRTIRECKSILKGAGPRSRDPMIRWEIGDRVVKYLEREREEGFVVLNHVETFARGLGLAKSYVEAILRFRERYPDKSKIRTNISWGSYYELVWFNDPMIMKGVEEQVLTAGLLSRGIQEIRKAANKKLPTLGRSN
jgi:hypothetical protein